MAVAQLIQKVPVAASNRSIRGRSPVPAMEALTNDAASRLTSLLVQGDGNALATLYEAHFEWMLALLRDSTRRDDSFALDCAQDAWLRIARRPVRCESAALLQGWLRRVALTAALDRLRSDASRRLRERQHMTEREVRSSLESITALRGTLRRVNDDDRDLLVMRFRAGMTLGQIGAALGVGAAAVDSRLRRLLATLRTAAHAEPDHE